MEPNLVFFNRCFDKGRLKTLISWFLIYYGEKATIELVENLKELGFKYATQAGISLSLDDLQIPPTKALIVSEAELVIQKTQIDYKKGHVTAVENFQKLIDTWHRASEILKQNVIQHFKSTNILNPVYMMAFSGARGNISQVRQLVGMRGLMADPQGQIINFPIKSNFREGLTLTEYVISCYGARKGLVDTALRTANSGYLTRRLVDVSQHIIICQIDCGTTKGVVLSDMKEGQKIILSLQNRLVGRTLAENIEFYLDDSFQPSKNLQKKILQENLPFKEPLKKKIFFKYLINQQKKPQIFFKYSPLLLSLSKRTYLSKKKERIFFIAIPLGCFFQRIKTKNLFFANERNSNNLKTQNFLVNLLGEEPSLQNSIGPVNQPDISSGPLPSGEEKLKNKKNMFFIRPPKDDKHNVMFFSEILVEKFSALPSVDKKFFNFSSTEGKATEGTKNNFLSLRMEEKKNKKKSFFIFRNQQVSTNLASKISKIRKKVLVRSPLTCEAKNSICQLCYGWSLANGNLVSLGEAVGILAAQSIGEPGTQLTMRTFHTGGVFSGDIMQEIRSPYTGIIEFSEILQGTLIRTPHGKIAFLTKNTGELLISEDSQNSSFASLGCFASHPKHPKHPNHATHKEETKNPIGKNITTNQKSRSQKIKIPSATILFVRHGEKVLEKQLIAEFSSMSADLNQRIQAKHNLKSEREGQIFFEDVLLTVTFGKDGDITRTANKVGSLWILAGKIYQSTIPSLFVPKVGDLLDEKSIINQSHSFLPYNGFLETNLSTVGKRRENIFKNTFPSDPSENATKEIVVNTPLLTFSIKNIRYHQYGYFLSIWNKLCTNFFDDLNNLKLNQIFSKNDQFFLSNSIKQEFEDINQLKESLYYQWFPTKYKTLSGGKIYCNTTYWNKNDNTGQIYWIPEENYKFEAKKLFSLKVRNQQGYFDFSSSGPNFLPTGRKPSVDPNLSNLKNNKNKNLSSSFTYGKPKVKDTFGLPQVKDTFGLPQVKEEKYEKIWLEKKQINLLRSNRQDKIVGYSSVYSGWCKISQDLSNTSKKKVAKAISLYPLSYPTVGKREAASLKKGYTKEKAAFSKFSIPVPSVDKKFFKIKKQKRLIQKQTSTTKCNHSKVKQSKFLLKNRENRFYNFKHKIKNFDTLSFFNTNYTQNISLNDQKKAKFEKTNFCYKNPRSLSSTIQTHKFLLKKTQNFFSGTEVILLRTKPKNSYSSYPFSLPKVAKQPCPSFTFGRQERQKGQDTSSVGSRQEKIKNYFKFTKINKNFFFLSNSKELQTSNFGQKIFLKQLPFIAFKNIFTYSIFKEDSLSPKFSSCTYGRPQVSCFSSSGSVGKKTEIKNGLKLKYKKNQKVVNSPTLQLNIKPGWIYFPQKVCLIERNSPNKHYFSEFGSKSIDDFIFDQHIVSFESILPNKHKNLDDYYYSKKQIDFKILFLKKNNNFSKILKTTGISLKTFYSFISLEQDPFVKKKSCHTLQAFLKFFSFFNASTFGKTKIKNYHKTKKTIFKKMLKSLKTGRNHAKIKKSSTMIKDKESKNSFNNFSYYGSSLSSLSVGRQGRQGRKFSYESLITIGIKSNYRLSKIYFISNSKTRFAKTICNKETTPFGYTKQTRNAKFLQDSNLNQNILQKYFLNKYFESAVPKVEKFKKNLFFSTFFDSEGLSSFVAYKATHASKNSRWSSFGTKEKEILNLNGKKKVLSRLFLLTKFLSQSFETDSLTPIDFFSKLSKKSINIGKEKFYRKQFWPFQLIFKPLAVDQKKIFILASSEKIENKLQTTKKKQWSSSLSSYGQGRQETEGTRFIQNCLPSVITRNLIKPQFFVLIRKAYEYTLIDSLQYKKLFFQANQPILNSVANYSLVAPFNVLGFPWFNKQKNTSIILTFPTPDIKINSNCPFPTPKKDEENSSVFYYLRQSNLVSIFISFSISKKFPLKKAKIRLFSQKLILGNNLALLLFGQNSFSFLQNKNATVLLPSDQSKVKVAKKLFFTFGRQKTKNQNTFNFSKVFNPLEKVKYDSHQKKWNNSKSHFVPTGLPCPEEDKQQNDQIKKLLTMKEVSFNNCLYFSFFRKLDFSSFLISELKTKNNELRNTTLALFSQNWVSIIKPLSVTSFLSPYKGELVTRKVESLTVSNEGRQRSLILLPKDQMSFLLDQNSNCLASVGKNYVGKLIRYGENISNTRACFASPISGQIIQIEKSKVVLRKATPVLFSSDGVFHVYHGDFVEKNAPLLTLYYQRIKTGDIVQGIPKIEQFFEARQTKEGEILPENLHEKLQEFFNTNKQHQSSQEAARKSLEKIQKILVDGVQKVYQSQGVTIADKHLELIVRQMTSKVRILQGGQTGLLRGELIDLNWIEIVNKGLSFQKAEYEPIILGITKASLETESFISAASFQETTRILARAAIERKTDFLRGLKENVILGHLIPAGTGFSLSFDARTLEFSTEGTEAKKTKV